MANKILPKRGTATNINSKLAQINNYELVYNTTNKTLGIKDGTMQWFANDTNLVRYNDVTSYNPFGGKYLYTNFLNNAFYAFDKRYFVTVTTHLKSYGGSTYPKKLTGLPLTDYQWEDSPVVSTLPAAALFDGNYENNIRIPAGHYGKISIKFNDAGTANFLNYPYGTYYMSFYHQSVPEEVKVRTYNNYAAQTVGWKEGSFSYLVGNANSTSNVVVQHTDTGNYQRSKIEFIVVAKDTIQCQPTDLDWKLTRPSTKDTTIISKMHDSTMFTTLSWKQKETTGTTVSISPSGINMGSTKLTNLATPTNNTDGATKKYVDDGLFLKADKEHTQSWTSIEDRPTTLSGYGITNAVNTTGDQTGIAGNKSFTGNITIGGSLTVSGEQVILNATTVETADDVILLRKGANIKLANPAGIAISYYNTAGNTAGIIIKDEDGELRVGKITIGTSGADKGKITDTSAAQPILTRNEKGSMGGSGILEWDNTNKRAVTKAAGSAGQFLSSSGAWATPVPSLTMSSGTSISTTATDNKFKFLSAESSTTGAMKHTNLQLGDYLKLASSLAGIMKIDVDTAKVVTTDTAQDNIGGNKTFMENVAFVKIVDARAGLTFNNNAYIEYDSGSKSIKFRFV